MMQKWRQIHPGGRRSIVGSVAFVILYALVVALLSQSADTSAADKVDNALASKMTQKRYDVYTQITSVNALTGEATARIEPWPLDDTLGYRYRSGWMPLVDVNLHVDSIQSADNSNSNVYTFKNNVPTGGVNATIDESSNSTSADISHYPFDKYKFEVPMSAEYIDAKKSVQNLPILPLDYTRSIDTFQISMKHVLWTKSNEIVSALNPKSISDAVGEYNNGLTSSVFTAERSASTKLLTIIILFLMFTALGSVAVMSYLIASHKRPPSLIALTWAAALTFSLIGLRSLFPGSPPIGIIIDKVFYFPSLLATLLCSLLILVEWSYREDFKI